MADSNDTTRDDGRHERFAHAIPTDTEALSFVSALTGIFLLVDARGEIAAASPDAQRAFALGEGRSNLSDLLDASYVLILMEILRNERNAVPPFPFTARSAAGGKIDFEAAVGLYKTAARKLLYLSCSESPVQKSENADANPGGAMFRAAFQSAPLGLVILSEEGRIADCNRLFAEMFALPKERLVGFDLRKGNIRGLPRGFRKSALGAVSGDSSKQEIEGGGASREAQWISLAFAPVFSRSHALCGAIGIAEDITASKRNEEKIEFVSTHDVLTGALNRRACEEALVALDVPENMPVGVIYADLNNLKLANDVFGHSEGDLLLRSCAAVLETGLTANDTVYRWGGDEFVVLLKNTERGEVKSRVRQIAKACENWQEGQLIRLSVAMGTAVKAVSGQSIGDALEDAEEAMYAAKLEDAKRVRREMLASLEACLGRQCGGLAALRVRRMGLWADWAIRKLGVFGSRDQENIRALFRYHDIGLSVVPEEFELIRENPAHRRIVPKMRHVAVGYRIGRGLNELVPIADYILAHHEWWNGCGYPNQLVGEEIPFASRLVSIFDAVEGMLSLNGGASRPSVNEIVEMLEFSAGGQFDPQLAETIAAWLRDDLPTFWNDMEDM